MGQHYRVLTQPPRSRASFSRGRFLSFSRAAVATSSHCLDLQKHPKYAKVEIQNGVHERYLTHPALKVLKLQ